MNCRYVLGRILCGSLLPIAFVASGQTIENVKATFGNGKVTVVYDLTGGNLDRQYSLELYSSHNNFSSPLKLVSGDVGKNIKGGQAKKIVWDAAGELVTYSGQITFRVKGNLIPLSLVFKNPAEGGSVRRGKNAIVQWEGGTPDQTIRFELYRGGERVTTVAETKNSGQYTWQVPKDLGKGSYTLKLNAGQESTSSGAFLVKSRIPLFLKLSPLIIVAAVIAFWPDGGEPPPPPGEELPDAPVPK